MKQDVWTVTRGPHGWVTRCDGEPRLTFQVRAQARAHCNRMMGKATRQDIAITLKMLADVKRKCAA